ncbi:hypothetical protein M409DRAFT_20185 [Zasmidium cellare ATCC 36951]|uniref:Mediator of RNA polymerase II transcription subunit 9 n=1 Tax=Zasmidium cellare ATCC 36951 TaxID=1080233 RepID=A0A6A6CRQ8_ZASCE|nr:uncharacterized protein M409DRAFT_20185 [Zasmidium cellare ATCC 36951]KAF2169771.1 hypothetical protein M409DRAFT_20185 [Zasmidium cellare ATCC 36951]
MALKQPIKTTTNAPAQSTDTAAALHLPPPQTFDILPALYELLARVDKHQNQTSLPGEPEGYHTLEGAPGDIGATYSKSNPSEHQQPLNPKDLPTAALEIKGLIRNALREVEKLPDVDRDVEEQEEEIGELEERVRRQREMLRGLAEVAKGMEGRLGG